MRGLNVLILVSVLVAAASAQVSAPRRILSYEVRDQSETLHNLRFEIEGFEVWADSAVRVGNEFTLRNAKLTFPGGADVSIRKRTVFTGDALKDLPTK